MRLYTHAGFFRDTFDKIDPYSASRQRATDTEIEGTDEALTYGEIELIPFCAYICAFLCMYVRLYVYMYVPQIDKALVYARD